MIQNYCRTLESELARVMIGNKIEKQYDSRSFGSHLEQNFGYWWEDLVKDHSWNNIPAGKRSIYDFAYSDESGTYGFDVKTKDLDAGKYSDGGVCSVANLLKFSENGTLFIVEVGHAQKEEHRRICYVKVVPIHCIDIKFIKIENLGTGQVRLTKPLDQIKPVWNQTKKEFLTEFRAKAKDHYLHVAKIARKRANAL